MATTFKPPTRDQLSKLTDGDARMVRALEELFSASGQGLPTSFDELNIAVSALEQEPTGGNLRAQLYDKQDDIKSISSGCVVYVYDKDDFPNAISGVITLDDGVAYIISKDVDLLGDRLVSGVNTIIQGFSTNASTISSTGLTGVALLTSTETVTLKYITLTADVALDLDGSAGDFLDWIGVNITDTPTVGTIKNYDNVIWLLSGLINSANLTFDGTIGTIGIGDSLLLGRAGETTVIIADTAVITRRFRPKFCAFVTPTGGTAIDFSALATVPDENYILFECNFGGAGTALSGVTHEDNKSAFKGNVGIQNSTSFGNYYMVANATSTSMTTSTPAKLLGTTTANAINERVTHSDNRLTYTGSVSRIFEVEAWASLTSNNNNILRIYIAKNGTAITAPIGESTASASGRAESIGVGVVVEMVTNDYIEVFASNETGNNAITAVNLNVIMGEL